MRRRGLAFLLRALVLDKKQFIDALPPPTGMARRSDF